MTSALDTVREIYAAMAAGDVDHLFQLLDPACTVSQDERLPWGGRHVGHAGFAAFGSALRRAVDSRVTHQALFEADGDVLQYGRTSGTVRATGTTSDIPEVHRWTIRDGRAVALHSAIDTGSMLMALGRSGEG